jgi:hypothetical protein
MAKSPVWFMARNASERPTLMHAVEMYADHWTICGLPIATWSRFFINEPIRGFACKKCARKSGLIEQSRKLRSVS